MAQPSSKNTQAKVMVLLDSNFTTINASNPLQTSQTSPATGGDSVQKMNIHAQAIPIQLIDENGNVTGVPSNPLDVDLI